MKFEWGKNEMDVQKPLKRDEGKKKLRDVN